MRKYYVEPYQAKITKTHSSHKRALVGSGLGKSGPPYTTKVSLERSKSAPPIGEGILQEFGAPDWTKLLPLIEKEGLWTAISEDAETIKIVLKKDLYTMGIFKAELMGFAKSGRPVYTSHSNLNSEYHGKYLGALGYFLLIEHITRSRKGFIASNETFGGYTSFEAAKAWQNSIYESGLVKKRKILVRNEDEKIELTNYIERTVCEYSSDAPSLFGKMISADSKIKEFARELAALVTRIQKTYLIRLKSKGKYYKISIQSDFPQYIGEFSIRVLEYKQKNGSYVLHQTAKTMALAEFPHLLTQTLPETEKVFLTIKKDEKKAISYFKKIYGQDWLDKTRDLFYDTLRREEL